MSKGLRVLPLLLLFTSIAIAQPFIDIVDVQYQAFTREHFKNDPAASAATSTFKASLAYPVKFKSGNVLLFGFDHLHHFIDYRSDSISYQSDLYSTGLRFIYNFGLNNPKWRCLLMAVPKINADFKSPLSSDLQMGGAVLFIWEPKPTLKFKFGGYYNREFYGNYYMTLLGIDWKVNDRLNIFGILPAGMNIEYKLHPKFRTTLSYRNANPSFRTTGNQGDSYVLDGDPDLGDSQLYLLLNYYPGKNIMLYAGFGQTLFRYFEEYDKFKEKTVIDPALAPMKDQQFLTIGASYRIRFD